MSGNNTAEQWGTLCGAMPQVRLKELRFGVEKAKKSYNLVVNPRIAREVNISSRSTIEIGAGAGTRGAAFARHGARGQC